MRRAACLWGKRIFGATAVCALLVAPLMAATEAIDIGKTVVVVRTVTGTLATQVRKLVIHEDVRQSEVIATEPDAATEIEFVDGTKLTVGPSARLTLDRFVYDPNPTKSAFFLTLTEGVFRFVTGNMAHQSYSIQTPNGTIGVRGTSINVDLFRDADGVLKTTVCVESGHAYGQALNGISKDYFAGDCFTVTEQGVQLATTDEANRNAKDIALTDVTILAGIEPTAGPGPGPGVPGQTFLPFLPTALGNCITPTFPGGRCSP